MILFSNLEKLLDLMQIISWVAMFSKRAYDQHRPISHLFLSNQHPRQLVVFWYSLLKIPVFIFFLAEFLILDLGPLETFGGENGMLCASFSSASKEKDALLQCVANCLFPLKNSIPLCWHIQGWESLSDGGA